MIIRIPDEYFQRRRQPNPQPGARNTVLADEVS